MSLDEHLAGARRLDVWITCQACGTEFDGEWAEEYGQGSLAPEECPACGTTRLESEPR